MLDETNSRQGDCCSEEKGIVGEYSVHFSSDNGAATSARGMVGTNFPYRGIKST